MGPCGAPDMTFTFTLILHIFVNAISFSKSYSLNISQKEFLCRMDCLSDNKSSCL